MNIKKCDRCGDEIPGGEYHKVIDRIEQAPRNNPYLPANYEAHDLCHDCHETFLVWFRGDFSWPEIASSS